MSTAALRQKLPSPRGRGWPRAWTMRQVAEHLSSLLGRPIVYNHRSTEEQRATLLADGLPPLVADLLVGLDQMFRESALGETTSTVEALTGKSPRTLPQWLAENIEIFRQRTGAVLEARKISEPLVSNP
jgi:NAD(P)H dehydrogenase (quinone)